ncbi:ribbon-helix-helix protein, CopG family [Microbacterium sp. NPDC003461]|jgi:predicted transcriptional regulator
MAMTLRIPEELDEALTAIAEAEHTSKHALILSGLEQLVRERLQAAQVTAGLEVILARDKGLLKRLEDA